VSSDDRSKQPTIDSTSVVGIEAARALDDGNVPVHRRDEKNHQHVDVTTERHPDFVQSLARGLDVLRTFDAEHPALTLAEVARRAGLTRATARRLLLTFQTLDYMSSDGKLFELTPRVLDLGYAYVSSLQLPEIAQPYMESLSELLNESVSAAVLDGHDIVYVARVPTKHVMSISLGLGSRLPAAVTSMGRVLLAGLSQDRLESFLASATWAPRTGRTIRYPDELRHVVGECRRVGFAVVDEELEDNVRSVAAPLTDSRGRVVAALNVGTSAARVSLADLHERVVPELLASARTISARLARR
jgi:IclR family transcriptional regulator, pca regulon regulatory protein